MTLCTFLRVYTLAWCIVSSADEPDIRPQEKRLGPQSPEARAPDEESTQFDNDVFLPHSGCTGL